jgi:hypothetical protein
MIRTDEISPEPLEKLGTIGVCHHAWFKAVFLFDKNALLSCDKGSSRCYGPGTQWQVCRGASVAGAYPIPISHGF